MTKKQCKNEAILHILSMVNLSPGMYLEEEFGEEEAKKIRLEIKKILETLRKQIKH